MSQKFTADLVAPCGMNCGICKAYLAYSRDVPRYGMSMVENQKMIKEKGMNAFLESQAEQYLCPNCGDVVSVHDGKCYKCSYQGPKPKGDDPKLRWVPNKKS
jgi:predicted RNA-binding Zn-ribbon protein involved in translation (DUF1610 family)